MDKEKKGIGWFILELYTPTPPDHTTYISADIHKQSNTNILVDTSSSERMHINTKSNSNVEIDVGSNEVAFINNRTSITLER